MNKKFISDVLTVKKDFDFDTITTVVDKVKSAGELLTQYNTLRSK